jgi:hypothetical protein
MKKNGQMPVSLEAHTDEHGSDTPKVVGANPTQATAYAER